MQNDQQAQAAVQAAATPPPAPAVDPNAQPQPVAAPVAPPPPVEAPPVPPVAPVQPQAPTEATPQPSVGTEHTQGIVDGQPVMPFEGIDPAAYQDHLAAEFAFMASAEFQQLPSEIQVAYAKHVIAERELLMRGGARGGNTQ